MILKFYKYQGTGNDFIIIDNRTLHFDSSNVKLVSNLCDRRFGIGADGLMLVEDHESEDFKMRYFNSDGKEASMCGNGGRCIAAFVVENKIIDNPEAFTFMAVDGIHEAKYNQGIVSLKMINLDSYEENSWGYFMNTGSPHVVQFTEDLTQLNVVEKGKNIRHDQHFAPNGTNVNFVEIKAENNLFVRTFERGVEDETFACGTGVVASAIATYLKTNQSKSYNIEVKGGKLQVSFDESDNKKFKNIWLTGPATFVFEGEIEI